KLDIPDESPLQAVVLADSYNRRFEVLCADRPRILLPLCSTPLLTWTLEALSLSKVKQVFLFCGVHAEQIREFVEQSPYRRTLDIQCLSSQTARTPGDALRELDSMGVLNGDNPFILVHSPLVSNYDLSKMVDAHKRRREADPNYIMTLGVGQGGSRRHPESPIMLVHPPSSRLLHYASHPLVPSTPRVAFPSHLFTDPFPASIDSYEIWSGTGSSGGRGGYRDLGVDICELDVPALCTENFDYHDLRRHFVNGVLTSDLLGKKIAVHLVGGRQRKGEGRYIERVRDTRTYGEITRDVLHRWAFPLAPDLNEPGGTQYELRAGNVYIARDNVMLSRTTTIRGPALIGPASSLQSNTSILRSTLGTLTTLGPNSSITDSYIFDNVLVGSHCHLDNCIIGKDVVIADDVTVGRGALVGDGVKLGKGVQVPPWTRVGRERWRPEGWEEGDEDQEAKTLRILGDQSLGFIWPTEEEQPSSDSESDGEDPYEHPRNKSLLQLGRSLSNLSSSTGSLSTLSKASSSPASIASDLDTSSDEGYGDVPSMSLSMALPTTGPSAEFTKEAQLTLERGYEEGYDVVNIGTEMGLLFPAYNAGVESARKEIIGFVLSKIPLAPGGGAAGVLGESEALFKRWKPIFPKFTQDYTALVLDMQAYVVEKRQEMGGWFGLVLRGAYEADLVDEGVLVRWRDDPRARGEGQGDAGAGAGEGEQEKWVEVWKKGKMYVDVLEEMESGSEEESGEEEEEEEESSEHE
ncbi:nucleotide-diphospho-sugar transferase, partial [Dioszegia hungarica]